MNYKRMDSSLIQSCIAFEGGMSACNVPLTLSNGTKTALVRTLLMNKPVINTLALQGKAPSLLDLGMKLHVPYNNDFALIDRLLPFAPYIRSIYLPCNHTVLGSGRYEGRATNRNWENYDAEVKEIAEIVAPHGIKVNMLLNSLHIPSDILNNFQGSALYRYLKEYENSTVEWLTVANIQLAILLRSFFPSFKLDVSVLGLIDTVKRAQYWFDLVHPELFCVDLDHSKDLNLIKNITALTGVPVKVLVMDFCLPDCPYKPWHYIHNSLKEENAFSCWQIRADKPWSYYKGRNIPPYYLSRYEGLIKDIKIVERNSDTDTILRNIRHFAESSDSRYMIANGGVVQEGNRSPVISSSVDKLYYNLNSKHPLFKPLPENIFERTLTCDLNCGVCTFCYDSWKEEWQVREDYELLAGFVRRNCPEPASLRFYLGLLDTLHGQRHNVVFIESIRLMEEYVEEFFKQILNYFSGLAFIEFKSPLADNYINRLDAPELREQLHRVQVSYSDNDVIRYTSFDQHDNNSFVSLHQLSIAAESDTYACYHLVEYYLKMREETTSQHLLESLEMDDDLLERFILAAFNSGCYDTVIRLTERLDTVIPPSGSLYARLIVTRLFSKMMRGEATKEDFLPSFVPSTMYGEKENFAHLYLNALYNDICPNSNELEVLADYAAALQSQKSRARAKMVYAFILKHDPQNLTLLKRYHQLLLDSNNSAEAAVVSSTIDQLYRLNGDELSQIERIQPQSSRFAALAKNYYNIKDFENAASYASKVIDVDPSVSAIWDVLLQSLKNIGDGARFIEYSRLRAELQVG